jgi:hypothetical protein
MRWSETLMPACVGRLPCASRFIPGLDSPSHALPEAIACQCTQDRLGPLQPHAWLQLAVLAGRKRGRSGMKGQCSDSKEFVSLVFVGGLALPWRVSLVSAALLPVALCVISASFVTYTDRTHQQGHKIVGTEASRLHILALCSGAGVKRLKARQEKMRRRRN